MAITVSWTNTVTRVNVHGIEQHYKVCGCQKTEKKKEL